MNAPKQGVIINNTVEDLREWFRSNTREAEHAYAPGMGLKALNLPGDIRDMTAPQLTSFWGDVSKLLPEDAAFVQWGDSQYVLQAISQGRYLDGYCVLISSRDWPVVPEAGAIPPLNLTVVDGSLALEDES